MTYRTAYDVTYFNDGLVAGLVVFLIAGKLCLWCYRYPERVKHLNLIMHGRGWLWGRDAPPPEPPGELFRAWNKVTAVLGMVIAAIGLVVLPVKIIISYADSREARAVELKISEGKVAQFRPTGAGDNGLVPGHFCAGETCFDYDDYDLDFILKEGLAVRVTHGSPQPGVRRIYRLELGK